MVIMIIIIQLLFTVLGLRHDKESLSWAATARILDFDNYYLLKYLRI